MANTCGKRNLLNIGDKVQALDTENGHWWPALISDKDTLADTLTVEWTGEYSAWPKLTVSGG